MRVPKNDDVEQPVDCGREDNELVDLESLVVSHYLVEQHLSYDEVRQMMNQSRATVARRLQHAKREGWLIEHPVLNIPPKYEKRYESLIHETELQKKLHDTLEQYGLRSVTVVNDKDVGAAEDYQVARRVGQATANRLRAALANRDGLIGINWGHSMRWVAEHISISQGENRNLRFVPLLGNLSVDEESTQAYEEAQSCSSNVLARRCAEAFNARPPRTLTTPAIISKIFINDKHKRDIIWELIEEDISYQCIFGIGHHVGKPNDRNALVNQLDTIVSGMSSLLVESALVSIAKLVTPDDLASLRDAGYVGDLGGHPIMDPERDPDPRTRSLAESASALVVSPTPADFIRVAERSRDEDRKNTGVFITGIGKQKARAFLAAIKMRAVNELCTDRATAQEMADILGLE